MTCTMTNQISVFRTKRAKNHLRLPRSHCPVASSFFTQSRHPFQQAMCRGVFPQRSCSLIGGLHLSNTFTTFTLLLLHASCRAVRPSLFFQLTGALFFSSSITRLTSPLQEASTSSTAKCCRLLCRKRRTIIIMT